MQETPQIPHRLTGRMRLDTAVNSLLGLIEGIAIDGHINETETAVLSLWLEDHLPYASRHPFNELLPALSQALADGKLDEEERADLTWLCKKLVSRTFYDEHTADLQRLQALIGGIACDSVITIDELLGLADWLIEHEHLKTRWPYDEVNTLVCKVLIDKRIDRAGHAELTAFFSDFLAVLDDRVIGQPAVMKGKHLTALMATDPHIVFEGRSFCFTGGSERGTRSQLANQVLERGGKVSTRMTGAVDYLVIGANGNPCWAYARYGRKIEQAVTLRKNGGRLVLVGENDFHDAVADTAVLDTAAHRKAQQSRARIAPEASCLEDL